MSISESKKSTAINLYKLGYSQAAIGKRLGISGQAVGKILRLSKQETCVGGYNELRSAVAKKHEKIKNLYANNFSLTAIAKEMGMSVPGVFYVIKRN